MRGHTLGLLLNGYSAAIDVAGRGSCRVVGVVNDLDGCGAQS
jgi:hypothetical protein